MSNEYIKMIEQRLIEMREKKELSPAQKKHLDKDNDGDIDGKDFEMLRKKKSESSDKMTPCPSCEGSMENHDPECPKAKNESTDLDDKSATKALKHDCATHVTSEQWGYGECISGQHTLEEQEDGTGIVTHYDVMFDHGVEFNVSVEDLTIIQEKSHLHASKKKMKESADRAKHYKGATKPETMLDKYKGAGAKKMATDNNVESPKEADITPEEKGHEDATKAGRAVSKQAPVRRGESRKGDTSIVNPVKGAVTKTTGRE